MWLVRVLLLYGFFRKLKVLFFSVFIVIGMLLWLFRNSIGLCRCCVMSLLNMCRLDIGFICMLSMNMLVSGCDEVDSLVLMVLISFGLVVKLCIVRLCELSRKLSVLCIVVLLLSR